MNDGIGGGGQRRGGIGGDVYYVANPKSLAQVICGSADRMVYVWDTASRKLLYKLPGHTGSVNDVDCHPTQPILMTGSSDKSIFLGELK